MINVHVLIVLLSDLMEKKIRVFGVGGGQLVIFCGRVGLYCVPENVPPLKEHSQAETIQCSPVPRPISRSAELSGRSQSMRNRETFL